MPLKRLPALPAACCTLACALIMSTAPAHAQGPTQRTMKPPLHGQEWMAITGKPLAATAGAMIFQQGGNAVDAAAAMIAATWSTVS